MKTLPRGLAATIPVAIVIVVLAAGALTHSLASMTTVILIGVLIGVTTARQVASRERWAWAASMVVALVLLVWAQQGDRPAFETTAVVVALLAITGVFYRWFRFGTTTHADRDPRNEVELGRAQREQDQRGEESQE
ncbi:hypothetical protein [Gordonia sp. (in: high G+C Gram-positive bacteria)]|uniref:hypothetical protein n=1 Tax=Gordonia sp. (in: high G+C Gram-positive bacteria) TaxID=84139 RepID=UPI003F950931